MGLGRRVPVLLAIATIVACSEGDSGGDDPVTPMDPGVGGSGSGDSDTGVGTATTSAQACEASAQCPDGACAAPHMAGLVEPPAAELFTCRDACIPAEFVSLWCLDDEGCCDAGAICERGLCRVGGGGGSGSDTATGSGTATDGGSGTGTGTGTGTATSGGTTTTSDGATTSGSSTS